MFEKGKAQATSHALMSNNRYLEPTSYSNNASNKDTSLCFIGKGVIEIKGVIVILHTG